MQVADLMVAVDHALYREGRWANRITAIDCDAADDADDNVSAQAPPIAPDAPVFSLSRAALRAVNES